MHQQLAVRTRTTLLASATLQAFQCLQSWDLTNVKEKLVMSGEYASEEVDAIEIEYKKYLALCVGYPNQAFPTPRKLDPMWHQHILFTKDYAAMCRTVAGNFIHHLPFTNGQKADASAQAELSTTYCREFGHEPMLAVWGEASDECCRPCSTDPNEVQRH